MVEVLAWIEAFCGNVRSTSSSGRSDEGKNWRGISGSSRIEPTNSANVTAMVIQRSRSARTRKLLYQRTTIGGLSSAFFFGGRRITTLISGVKTRATSQDTSRAIVTTANNEKVYSPAELWAKPTGTKPAMVTKVPASMAKA